MHTLAHTHTNQVKLDGAAAAAEKQLNQTRLDSRERELMGARRERGSFFFLLNFTWCRAKTGVI